VTDAISDLLLTSCRDADENLLREGIPARKIKFVGNVMIDSLVQLLPKARTSTVLADHGLKPRSYVAVTLHRPSNVDDPVRLMLILDELTKVAATTPRRLPHPPPHPQDAGTFEFHISNFKFLFPSLPSATWISCASNLKPRW
jgi:UDP-N-acetylglucosamine 2-epimerase (non-hydrolysing)